MGLTFRPATWRAAVLDILGYFLILGALQLAVAPHDFWPWHIGIAAFLLQWGVKVTNTGSR